MSPSLTHADASTRPSDRRGVVEAASRLIRALEQRVTCAPVRDLIGGEDVTSAYAVQTVLHERALEQGRRVTGRKIGLTAPTVQAQLGVDQPDFGVLYADMDATGDSRHGIDTARLLQPKIEAEVAFVLRHSLDTPGASGTVDLDEVTAAIGEIVPALEIVDSRITGWDISFGDTVADNASSGLYVLGPQRIDPEQFGPDLDAGLAELTMTMTCASVGGQPSEVSTGRGADCLGSPLRALAWLADTAARHGEPLRAGQVVLAGALGPMVPVSPGDTFVAHIPGLGSVAARFAPTSPTQQGSTR